MVKPKKTGVVPNLRFPEFRGADGWVEAPLEELITTITPPAKLPSSSYQKAGKYPIIDQSQQAICGWTDDENAVIEESSPLVIFGDHTCVLKFVRHPFVQGADGIKILKAKPVVSAEFLFHSLCHRPLVMEDYKRHFSILKKRIVAYPDSVTGEQQRIADCLTSMDELIAAQARKVEALKTYKRGLMQQLFPREGETVPRLRFPVFKTAPGWVEYPLSKLAEYENGKAYEQDIHEDGKYVVVNSRFISTDGAIRKRTNADYCIASEGDVLMVLSDLPKGRALAKCFYVDANETYGVNQRVARLTPTMAHPKFLYYRLNRHPKLLAYDDGLNQTHLSKGSVTDCPLLVPKDKGEQERIADTLTSLDAQISNASDTLDVLKTHKQALMQQLFPAVSDA